MFMATLISALQLIFLLGLVLAVIGQFGRRVFAKNSCWRCQFDLSGHPAIAEGPFPIVCPECGESISERKMLQIDKRVPHIGLRRAGLILMLAIVPLAAVFIRAGYSFDPYRVATGRAIIRIAESGDFQGIEEFKRRFDGGYFPKSTLRQLGHKAAEIIRSIPQDRIEPGSMQTMSRSSVLWGDVYLSLLRQELVTQEDARQLLRDIIRVQLRFPPHNRVGDPFLCGVDFYAPAVGLENLIPIGLHAVPVSIALGNDDFSGTSVTASDAQLTADCETINQTTTLASSWIFSVDSQRMALSDRHEGVVAVEANVVLQSDVAGELGFIATLIQQVHGGELGFALTGNLIVQPADDSERVRSAPNLDDIVNQHGTFGLAIHPMFENPELSFTIDERLDLPEELIVRFRAVVSEKSRDSILADNDLVITGRRRRSGLFLWGDTSKIVQDGGVWVELRAVQPYSRDQYWRPLVMTGDVPQVWVPLESPKP